MEWVEVTGRTVEEAKDAALDQLGVDEEEAEFEVLEEPRAGLFGRLRSEARVRARVMPTAPRPKVERRERRRPRKGRTTDAGGGGGAGGGAAAGGGGAAGGGAAAGDGAASAGGSGGRGGGRGGSRGGGGGSRGSGNRAVAVELDDGEDSDVADSAEDTDEVEVAESFLTGLLETFGAAFTVERRDLDEDMVELSVQGEGLGLLIGPRGQTLGAVQELVRTAVQRRSRGRAGRIVIDISGYRHARRTALERFANQVARQVNESGVARVLEPMPPADRKVVHDAINLVDGVTTSSEGEEPSRRVVISPDSS
jgi:spoIIIJ-associated protein